MNDWSEETLAMFETWADATEGQRKHAELANFVVKEFKYRQHKLDKPAFDFVEASQAKTLAGIQLLDQSQNLWHALVIALSAPDLRQKPVHDILTKVVYLFDKITEPPKTSDKMVVHDDGSADIDIYTTKHHSDHVHPDYYKDKGDGHHDLAFHEDQMFPWQWIVHTCIVTAMKYEVRAPYKQNPVLDLGKAETYLNRAKKVYKKHIKKGQNQNE